MKEVIYQSKMPSAIEFLSSQTRSRNVVKNQPLNKAFYHRQIGLSLKKVKQLFPSLTYTYPFFG